MERLLLALALFAAIGVALAVGRVLVAARKRRVLVAANANAPADGSDRVLFFSTRTCVQCREMQAPALERLRSAWPNPLVIEHIDAIDRADLAKLYGILTVPSTVVFAGGEARGVNYGFATAERIARQLRGDGYSI